MGFTNTVSDFKIDTNTEFLDKAEKFKPNIIKKDIYPVREIKIIEENGEWKVKDIGNVKETEKYELGKNSSICYDFGDHYVGYIDFDATYSENLPDAPLHIQVKLGEKPFEIGENSEAYNGVLGSGWIQEECLHIDDLPAHIEFPRRYAFRYMQIKVIDTSVSYKVNISNVRCKSVTSADMSVVADLKIEDGELRAIDRVSVKTMQECMQDVFEDGPKRDRRLWVGDLRLQALVNYETFKNYDLVKRCLYLVAGLTQGNGRLAACIYAKKHSLPSEVNLFDYSLLYISCLYDYYMQTNDDETLTELFPTVKRQVELASQRLDERRIIRDSDDWWCFIDWNDDLNKQASAQAIFIYCTKQYVKLAKIVGAETEAAEQLVKKAAEASLKYLWDSERGFFISGEERQISWASQIWFVLSGILNRKENAALMKRLIKENPQIGIKTPYAYHYFIQALFDCGMEECAVKYIKQYWGEMIADGADCFYEIFNPENKNYSPYGSMVINSYCHSWSGTPAYFIRKYLDNGLDEK